MPGFLRKLRIEFDTRFKSESIFQSSYICHDHSKIPYQIIFFQGYEVSFLRELMNESNASVLLFGTRISFISLLISLLLFCKIKPALYYTK